MKPTRKVLEIVQELSAIRKQPVLVLDLKEVQPSDCLILHKKLKGKRYPELDVILQTPGGDIDSAYNNAKLIRNVAEKVNFIIPLYAKSAGTLMCLSADKVIMTILSELGPLDTQIKEQQDGSAPMYTSALNGFKALEQVQMHTIETLDIATKLILSRSGMKMAEAVGLAAQFAGNTSGTLYSQLNPKKIGEYARALEIGERYGIMILTRFMGWSDDKAKNTVRNLVKQYPSHEFVIDAEGLKELGLPAEYVVEAKEDELVDELRMALLTTKNTLIELVDVPVSAKPAANATVGPKTVAVKAPTAKKKEGV